MLIIVILPALCCLYLFLLATRLPGRPMDGFPGLYAHRGLWNEDRPENSLPAFRAAVENGYGIELDVHITADDKLVVFHDDDLKRMCGDDRMLADCTLAQLRELRLKNTEETIPTFDEFLETVNGRVPLVVEIKTDKRVILLCEKINERLSRYSGPYCVESFDPRAVRWYKKHRPDIIRGQLTFGLGKSSDTPRNVLTYLLSSQLVNVLGRPDFIAADHTTEHTLPQRLTRAVFRPHLAAWTIRSQEDLDRLSGNHEILIFEKFIPSA